ncbi:hypothetical protein BGW38_009895 [Lunasporangiospora selenospora]|uniref:NADH-ubiquinone oxidoreductase 21kDa subunit N-terminal domain-containing protein n=1 Tax=Lunasporangiospora selenospora TaxID=979761 RepID=A0A9P6FWQ3_9FUNG|nr:hypothetical protein BGW38_009895 [Lunasporangiospora selenospora]
MSSAEKYIKTDYPVIDSDPHFNRVVRYLRGSDYASWGAITVAGPAAMLAFERIRPAAGPKGINVALGVATALGFMGGFLFAYQKSSPAIPWFNIANHKYHNADTTNESKSEN